MDTLRKVRAALICATTSDTMAAAGFATAFGLLVYGPAMLRAALS